MKDISLGKIPVYIDDKLSLIEILMEHYQVEEDNGEYINIRIYKNKYVLSRYVSIDNKIEYKDINIKFPVNLVNQVFNYNSVVIDIHNFKEKLEAKRNIIVNIFNSDKVNDIYNNLLNSSLDLYNNEKEFDYDIFECFVIYINNELNDLYSNYQDNIENIYILLSFKNIDFIDIYEEFYKILK